MLDQKQAFQHMVAWAIQNLYNCYVEANDIKADEKLTEAEKITKIKGPNGPDHRMINYMLLLKPALEQAELEFPDHRDNFFAWFKDRWALVQEMKLLEGQCKCKGCRQEETVAS